MLSSVSLLPGSTMLRAPTAQRGALVQMGGNGIAAPVLTEDNLRETLKRSRLRRAAIQPVQARPRGEKAGPRRTAQ